MAKSEIDPANKGTRDSGYLQTCEILEDGAVDLRGGDNLGRSPSNRVLRNTPAYIQALRLVLANSNSLMFIDPHVDPSRPRYQNFIQLLLAARRAPATRLEIHRCCYEGPPGNRTVFTGANQAVLEQRFRNAWAQPSKPLAFQLLFMFGQTSTTDS